MEIKTIAVLGAGTMGAGVAQVAVRAGYEVCLRDVTPELLARGQRAVEAGLEKAIELGKLTDPERLIALSRLHGTTRLEEAVSGADLVLEAVPEEMKLKQATFREVQELCPPHAIFASNTSSLSIDEMASASDRPQAFVGMHFFNPVPVMKLLELVVGRETSDSTVAAARGVAERLGKTVITVRDSPGFATSRLGVLLALEAIRMVEAGVASCADIDTALTLGYGHPMGPLRLTDLVGLDVRLKIAEYLHEKLGGEAFRPPELLQRMVAEGKLGKKVGRGFYSWES